jgi:hypothetical protein
MTIKMQIFPADDLSSLDIDKLLGELSLNGLIAFYSAENKDYLFVTGWHKHQRIDRRQPPRCPEPPMSIRRVFDERSTNAREQEKRREEEGSKWRSEEESKRKRTLPVEPDAGKIVNLNKTYRE